MADPEDRGLLGGLPRTRPRVDSPRRAAARAEAGEAGSGSVTGEEIAEPTGREESGFEQLARAGVGVAVGVAGVGVRLAGRTVGVIGKALGRR
jgi:hypothetical protein